MARSEDTRGTGPRDDGRGGFRRVVVALDSAAAGGPLLELAAELAAASACELHGLFVEDQDLLRLAALPFAREVQLARAMSRALAPDQILQDLRAQAGLARAAVGRQAARHRIEWSFQVIQGRSEEAVLLAAVAGDIIAMARGFGPFAEIGRLSGRARALAARAPGPLLLAGASPARGPVMLPYDASPAADALLPVALRLARARGVPLELLLLGAAAGDPAAVQNRLDDASEGGRLPVLRLWTPRDAIAALRYLQEADRGLLVLPVDLACFTAEQIERLVARARVPVVLQAGAPAE